MKVFLANQFIRSFRKFKKKNPQIVSKVEKKIDFFKSNPLHPSLRLHKLKGKKIEIWSFWVEGDLRITFIYIPEGILLINIGTHKEVY